MEAWIITRLGHEHVGFTSQIPNRGYRTIRTYLRHHLQSPTLLSTPILNWGEYFREPTRSYQTEVIYGSSWYVVESDPEEDPEEYAKDKAEDGPVYYPMDGGDDDDGDSSGYDV
nr:hypothetical protein [Tanacetum cinerariifolium]